MAGSSRIKGITIEIDGETTGLQKALNDVTKESIDIQKELKDVERLLKFDPGNTEALAQKQKLLSQQIEVTSKKLKSLKDAQEQVDKQFANGDIGEDQYRAFRREVEFTEKSLDSMKKSLSKLDDGNSVKGLKQDMDQLGDSTEEAEGKVGGLGEGLGQLAAGAGAIAGIGEVIEKAFDTSNLNTKLSISMKLDEGSQQTVKEAINNITSYGVDAEAALEGVRRQWALNKDASDESNAEVVKGAAAIVAAYGDVDFTELIQETNELSKTLGISNEDALALTYTLLKTGFPPDQLDIITEYGSQLHNAGYNAQEIQAIMASGVETGTWNIDVLLDGLKEGRIVLAEFGQGVDSATTELFSKIGVSGEQLQAWGKAVAEGGEGGKIAMQEVAQALATVDDKTLQNQLGTKVFGTLWEENGTKITDTILEMNDNLTTAEANQNNLNGAISDLDSSPMVQFQQAMADLKLALAPLLTIVAEVIGKFAEWISNNPTLAATITAIVSVLGILVGIVAGLAPIITMITSILPLLTGGIAAIATPVLIAIGVITALVAVGVLLYKNWDTIKAKTSEIWEGIKVAIGNAINGIVNFFTVTIPAALQSLLDFVSSNWQNLLLMLVSPLAGIFALLYTNCDGFREFINNFIINVKEVLVQGWEAIVTFFTESVPAWIESMFQWFSELGPKVAYALGETLGTIIKWGADVLNWIVTEVPKFVENIIKFFSELPGKVWTWLVNVVTKLKEWGSNVVSWISSNVSTWINNIVTFFSQLPSKIWTWLVNVVNNVKTWGSNMLSTAKSGMQQVLNGIVNTFVNLPSKMLEIGRNIVAGIKNGIQAAWNGMVGWIGGLCDSFVDGVKNALDIHSPSRVMEELGKFTGEGFKIGMESTVNSISKQADALASAAIPNVQQGEYSTSLNGLNANNFNGANESVLEKLLAKIDNLESAISNMSIYMDSTKVGKIITPKVSGNLAFDNNRKGW